MGKFNSNKVIRGTFGRAWVDGDLMANVKSFEAKATIDYEDLDINGDFGQKKRYMGYSIAGTGSLVVHKVYTRNIDRTDQILAGKDVRATLVMKLADPDAFGAERVALYDVHLDEITLLQFENKTVLEEEVPFTAGSFEFLDLIE